VIEMAFSTDDLVHTRFAISPLWEAVASLRLLRGAGLVTAHRHGRVVLCARTARGQGLVSGA
jgi:hypothetical protein